MAALANMGITEEDLQYGAVCDPQTMSRLNILARPGIILRLSRNLDKVRGFVNGAVCVVMEPLRGNSIFTAKLLSTEAGITFLPCCYGYATTIRRAQGVSLSCGAVLFDQHKHAAHRGYGYVEVSRFRTQAGCHLYGTLRATDFLPVGPEQPDEQLYRGAQSESVSESDYRGSEDSDCSVSWNRMSDESEDEREEAVSRSEDQSEVSSDESKCQRRRQNDFDVSD